MTCSSARPAKLLQPLLKEPSGIDKPVKVEILTRTKDEGENKKLFEQVIDTIGEGVRLSHLALSLQRRALTSCELAPFASRRTRSARSRRTR